MVCGFVRPREQNNKFTKSKNKHAHGGKLLETITHTYMCYNPKVSRTSLFVVGKGLASYLSYYLSYLTYLATCQ